MQDLVPYAIVISAAKSRTQIADFYTAGRLSVKVEQGYEARREALNELMKLGLVILDGSRLSLGILTNCSWLKEGLNLGTPAAWEIVDTFPKKSRKFDPDHEQLTEIGMRGELFVIDQLMRLLPEDTHDRILQISLTDDSAGFDISAPSVIDPEHQIQIEVKATTRPGDRFNFYLSRNEYETAKTSRNWYLMLVRLSNSQSSLFGYLEGSSILSYYPEDTSNGFSWMVTQGSFSKDDLRSQWP